MLMSSEDRSWCCSVVSVDASVGEGKDVYVAGLRRERERVCVETKIFFDSTFTCRVCGETEEERGEWQICFGTNR